MERNQRVAPLSFSPVIDGYLKGGRTRCWTSHVIYFCSQEFNCYKFLLVLQWVLLVLQTPREFLKFMFYILKFILYVLKITFHFLSHICIMKIKFVLTLIFSTLQFLYIFSIYYFEFFFISLFNYDYLFYFPFWNWYFSNQNERNWWSLHVKRPPPFQITIDHRRKRKGATLWFRSI